MRIVNISTHYQDGLGYQEYYLGKEWSKAGHEVHFIASDWHFNFPDYDKTVKHLIGDKYIGTGTFNNEFGIPVHRLKTVFRIFTGWKWLKGLTKKIKSLNPDLLIIHGIFNFHTLRICFTNINCPIIIDDHTTINVKRNGIIGVVSFFIFRHFFSSLVYRKSTKIIGISSSCIPYIKIDLNLNGPKIHMIPLGSDLSIFYPSGNKRERTRKKLGISNDQILVTYTGKIYEEKKVTLIIEALNQIYENYQKSNIVILIVGSISAIYNQKINDAISASKNRVIVRESISQEDLSEVYNASDISVWPAHTTTSTLDASACGCPIICSNYMEERYENNSGIGIRDGNLGDLINSLSKLIQSKETRILMGHNGYELIKNKYSWEIISKQFIDISFPINGNKKR